MSHVSQIVAASFLYPYASSKRRVVEPPGLTNTLSLGYLTPFWYRLELVEGNAVDIPPDTQVMTDQGWVLPDSLLTRKAKVKINTIPKNHQFKDVTLSIKGYKAFQVLRVEQITEELARVDTFSNNIQLGGASDSDMMGTPTQPEPADVCTCVLLNINCSVPQVKFNDFVSYPV